MEKKLTQEWKGSTIAVPVHLFLCWWHLLRPGQRGRNSMDSVAIGWHQTRCGWVKSLPSLKRQPAQICTKHEVTELGREQAPKPPPSTGARLLQSVPQRQQQQAAVSEILELKWQYSLFMNKSASRVELRLSQSSECWHHGPVLFLACAEGIT